MVVVVGVQLLRQEGLLLLGRRPRSQQRGVVVHLSFLRKGWGLTGWMPEVEKQFYVSILEGKALTPWYSLCYYTLLLVWSGLVVGLGVKL